MQDIYNQYGRGPALIQRKRGFGLPIVLASGATAVALAGFFVVAALGRNEPAEPLPPRSTPLEVAKAPTETVTGSLPAALRPITPPVDKPVVPPPPPPVTVQAKPEPAPAPAPPPAPLPTTALIQAPPSQPALTPAPAPTVVASAEISTTLPSPIPPLTAPPTAPRLEIAPTPAAPPAAAAPAPKPKAGPAPAEITVFTNRARDLIKSGDIAGARLLLERAASGEDGPSLLALAETYDPAVLNRWGVIGVRPDVEKARGLYQKAADRGIPAAKERMLALR